MCISSQNEIKDVTETQKYLELVSSSSITKYFDKDRFHAAINKLTYHNYKCVETHSMVVVQLLEADNDLQTKKIKLDECGSILSFYQLNYF